MVLGDLHSTERQNGFTVVEVIVTVVVVSIFLFSFFQGYMLLESQRINVARQATANDVAYSNLRKFTTPPIGISCSTSGTNVLFTPEVVSASSAIASQTVTAYPVNGCDGTNFGDGGVKIESKVQFDNGKEVVHASIVR